MPRNTRNSNVRGRRPRRTPNFRQLTATQGDGPAFAGQQIAVMDVPGDVRLATTTAGGSIAQVFAINASNIQTNFHGYFNSVFQEYRIRRVVFHISAISATAGATLFRFEEKNSGSPTLNEMANSISTMKNNNSACQVNTFRMTWTARDLVDLGFEQITTDPNSAFFKIFTDTTDLATPAASVNLWIFRPIATIEFRGLGLN